MRLRPERYRLTGHKQRRRCGLGAAARRELWGRPGWQPLLVGSRAGQLLALQRQGKRTSPYQPARLSVVRALTFGTAMLSYCMTVNARVVTVRAQADVWTWGIMLSQLAGWRGATPFPSMDSSTVRQPPAPPCVCACVSAPPLAPPLHCPILGKAPSNMPDAH